MIVVIDNYDSFTFNLVQYVGELGADLTVLRNDKATVADVESLDPERILISPGPCSPDEAGISCDIIRNFGTQIPVFGVCLGHQCIGQVYGGTVVRAETLMHGKTSMIHHSGEGVLRDMPNPFRATRYHSLIVERDSLPPCLQVTAETEAGEIMGLCHRELPVFGVQFHPESILTKGGMHIMKNFLSYT